MSDKRDLSICIIGSGASGLLAARQCLDEGLRVTIYEKTNFIGGLWRFHDEDVNGIASVTRSTIINSSKEMSAFSDHPPDAEYPNYMHNSKMIKYIDSYAEKHDLFKWIRYEHEVRRVEPATDHAETGRWSVTVLNKQSGKEMSETFDGVMVCTGHHVTPISPTFPDQEKFKGRIMHTHSYKRPIGFEGKKVVVVGVGNSGGDAAVELSQIADKVYLSTRRGVWIVYRVGPNGTPFDTIFLTRMFNTLFNLSPYPVVCTAAETYINRRFDHARYAVQPKHRIFGQHIMVNDALPNRILSGTVTMKGDISRFTENGLIFEGDDEETECDAVILATGYHVSFPFIDQSLVPTEENEVDLYKYVFSPSLPHSHTLAFIGLAQPIGPLFPISEIQSRWFALLMRKKLKLPSASAMREDIEKKRREMRSRYFQGPRHTLQVDWINYMDEIAAIIGVKPNLWKYFTSDLRLWKELYLGPCVPYQYRLEGPHSWPGAREAILGVQDRINSTLQTRKIPDSCRSSRVDLISSLLFFVLLILAALLANYLLRA